MLDWVENLIILQDNDMRLMRLIAQLKSVPADIKKVELEKKAADEIFAEAKATVQQYQTNIKSTETKIASLQQKKSDFQAKTTSIKDNKEYRSALEQIDNFKKQIGELEDRQLALLEELEEAKQAFERKEKEAGAIRARSEERINDLNVREKNTKAKVEEMMGSRPELMKKVPKQFLTRYERVRKSPKMQGGTRPIFVPIRDGDVCGGCHLNITAQVRVDAQKGQLVNCPNCSSMLYYE